MVVFTPPGGLSKINPIGRLIAGPLKPSLRIDEGLQPNDLMTVDLLPILRDLPGIAP